MTATAELRRATVMLGPRHARVLALNRVDLTVEPGEILGLVGESGGGKTTLALALLRLLPMESGSVRLEDQDISALSERRLRRLRGRMTMVFRNPYAVLNPRMTAAALIEEPLRLHTRLRRAQRQAAVAALAERLGLSAEELASHPGELAIDRLQLVALARALAPGPRLLVLDEPTRDLDSAAAAAFLAHLAALRDAQTDGPALAILLLSHDIAAVQPVADRVAVLYLGEIVEEGATEDLLRDPLHPYTQSLLSAHLPGDTVRRGRRIRLRGEPPTLEERTPGCGFAPRCPIAETRCRSGAPTPNLVPPDRRVACLRVLEGTSRIPLSR
jgi:oligopeptide/dipeptide ABC transporter ATP-binding protein